MDKRLELCIHYIRHNLCKDPDAKFSYGKWIIPQCFTTPIKYERCSVCDEFLGLDYIPPDIYYKDTEYGLYLKRQEAEKEINPNLTPDSDSDDEFGLSCLYE